MVKSLFSSISSSFEGEGESLPPGFDRILGKLDEMSGHLGKGPRHGLGILDWFDKSLLLRFLRVL